MKSNVKASRPRNQLELLTLIADAHVSTACAVLECRSEKFLEQFPHVMGQALFWIEELRHYAWETHEPELTSEDQWKAVLPLCEKLGMGLTWPGLSSQKSRAKKIRTIVAEMILDIAAACHEHADGEAPTAREFNGGRGRVRIDLASGIVLVWQRGKEDPLCIACPNTVPIRTGYSPEIMEAVAEVALAHDDWAEPEQICDSCVIENMRISQALEEAMRTGAAGGHDEADATDESDLDGAP